MIAFVVGLVLLAAAPTAFAFSIHRDYRTRERDRRRSDWDAPGSEDFAEVINKCVGRQPFDPEEARER